MFIFLKNCDTNVLVRYGCKEMETTNKQKILIKCVKLQELIIDDEYIAAMKVIDLLLSQIRYMTDGKHCKTHYSLRKGGVFDGIGGSK